MKLFLCVTWFVLCLMKSTLSAQAENDDSAIQERQPVFRRDYFLDEEQRGWFKLHRVPEKWHDARLICELEGAELASPLDANILHVMLEKMQSLYSVYTGIHSLFSHDDYYSLKGVSVEDMPVTWSDFVSSDEDKLCVVLLNDGRINNVKCHSELPFLCYKKNDNTPLTNCGTIDTEYMLYSELNTCYKLHKEEKTWEDAFKTCSAEGGALTVVNSDAEFAAVVQMFENDTVVEQNFDYKVYVGVVNWKKSGRWVTIHDENLKFQKWSPNTQVNGVEDCGALDRFGLVRVVGTFPAHFVCERRPNSLITKDQLQNIMNVS